MSDLSINEKSTEIKSDVMDAPIQLTYKERHLLTVDNMNNYFKEHNWVLVQFSDRETMFISKYYFRSYVEKIIDDTLVVEMWRSCRCLAKLYADEKDGDKWNELFKKTKKYKEDITLFFPFPKEHYNSVLDFLISPYSGTCNKINTLCGIERIFSSS